MADSIELPNGEDGWTLTDAEYQALKSAADALFALTESGVVSTDDIDAAVSDRADADPREPVEAGVTLSRAEYQELKARSEKLSRLEVAGVDNWEGYRCALSERCELCGTSVGSGEECEGCED